MALGDITKCGLCAQYAKIDVVKLIESLRCYLATLDFTICTGPATDDLLGIVSHSGHCRVLESKQFQIVAELLYTLECYMNDETRREPVLILSDDKHVIPKGTEYGQGYMVNGSLLSYLQLCKYAAKLESYVRDKHTNDKVQELKDEFEWEANDESKKDS